MAITDNSYA